VYNRALFSRKEPGSKWSYTEWEFDFPAISKQAFRPGCKAGPYHGQPTTLRTTFPGEVVARDCFRHDRRIALDQLTTILPCR